MSWSKKKKICSAIVFVSIALVLAIEIFFAEGLRATEAGNNFYEITVRSIGIAVFLSLALLMDYGYIFKNTANKNIHAWLALAAGFAIAINNFPFVSLINGDAYLGGRASDILIYALICFCVGCFEELAFRGFVFMVALEKMPKNKKGAFGAIFISSAIFGIVHGVNILAGGSVGGVLLQIGYSALIGALSAVMLMNTHNLWYSIFMHALYNFGGGVVPKFGGGKIWTAGEVALTVVVSLIVVAYVIYNFVRLPDAHISGVFGKTKEEKHDNA